MNSCNKLDEFYRRLEQQIEVVKIKFAEELTKPRNERNYEAINDLRSRLAIDMGTLSFGIKNSDTKRKLNEIKKLNAFLDSKIGYLNQQSGSPLVFKAKTPTFIKPKERDDEKLATENLDNLKELDEQNPKIGEYTINPEEQGLDFEKMEAVSIKLPEDLRGKELFQIKKFIVETYSKDYIIPGVEYWRWLAENQDKIPKELSLDYIYNVFFGSVARNNQWKFLSMINAGGARAFSTVGVDVQAGSMDQVALLKRN